MDTAEFKGALDDLSDSIDELEKALQPLLKQNLVDITSKLPLLDKAKLNVLTTYAIESMLFSVLKLSGVNAKEHPVFTELTRVKQYFAKIESAENGDSQKQSQNLKLDSSAAGRFIKHALAGNDRHDLQRAERQSREKVNSKIKFDELSEPIVSTDHSNVKKRKAVDEPEDSDSSSSSSSSSSSQDAETQTAEDDGTADKIAFSKATQRPKNTLASPSPSPSDSSKSKGHLKDARKVKSQKAPRPSNVVFQDLLNRPKKQA